jgi:hypothetical protein
VVQAQRLFAGGLLDQRLQDRPRRFDQLGLDLLDGQGSSGYTDAPRIGHTRPGHEHEHRPQKGAQEGAGIELAIGCGEAGRPNKAAEQRTAGRPGTPHRAPGKPGRGGATAGRRPAHGGVACRPRPCARRSDTRMALA